MTQGDIQLEASRAFAAIFPPTHSRVHPSGSATCLPWGRPVRISFTGNPAEGPSAFAVSGLRHTSGPSEVLRAFAGTSPQAIVVETRLKSSAPSPEFSHDLIQGNPVEVPRAFLSCFPPPTQALPR